MYFADQRPSKFGAACLLSCDHDNAETPPLILPRIDSLPPPYLGLNSFPR